MSNIKLLKPDTILGLLAFGVVLALASGPLARERLPRALALEAGVFLVAEPHLPDPRFHRSVVLLLDHDSQGSAGLIINKPTGARLGEAVPPLEGLDRDGHAVFFGGPVAIDGLTFLVRSPSSVEHAKHVVGDVYWSGSAETLRSLLGAGKTNADLRVFAGYSGWGVGQLEGEIARGDWRLVNGDVPTVFAKEPETLWLDLIEKAGSEGVPIRGISPDGNWRREVFVRFGWGQA